MGAVGSPQQSSHGKKGKKKKAKRHGFSLDMTPMVDVAFLLLTFFMLTTTFSKPQTMEITMPSKDVETKVAESNILTFNVLSGDSVYWSRGKKEPEYIKLYSTVDNKLQINKALKKVVKDEQQSVIHEIGEDNLSVVIRFEKTSKYRNMVDLIDELNLMNMKRFSLAQLSEEEKNALVNPDKQSKK